MASTCLFYYYLIFQYWVCVGVCVCVCEKDQLIFVIILWFGTATYSAQLLGTDDIVLFVME